jgi:hypothetical protein
MATLPHLTGFMKMVTRLPMRTVNWTSIEVNAAHYGLAMTSWTLVDAQVRSRPALPARSLVIGLSAMKSDHCVNVAKLHDSDFMVILHRPRGKAVASSFH